MRYSICVIVACLVLGLIATSQGASLTDDKEAANDVNIGELRDGLVDRLKRLMKAPVTETKKAEQPADSVPGPNLHARNAKGQGFKRARSPLNKGKAQHTRGVPSDNRQHQRTLHRKRGMQGRNKPDNKKPMHKRNMHGPANQQQRNLHKATPQGRSIKGRMNQARPGKRNLQRKTPSATKRQYMYNDSSDPLQQCIDYCDLMYNYNSYDYNYGSYDYYDYYDYYNYYNYYNSYDSYNSYNSYDYSYGMNTDDDYYNYYMYNGYGMYDMYNDYSLYGCFDGCYFSTPSNAQCNEGLSPDQMQQLTNMLHGVLMDYMR